MKIHFPDRHQAARFAMAIVNVTGREPTVARTENRSWLVQSGELNHELACAIVALLDQGTPSAEVTLERVTEQVVEERQKLRRPGDEGHRVRPLRGPGARGKLLVMVVVLMGAQGDLPQVVAGLPQEKWSRSYGCFGLWVRSNSSGETYPRDECRRTRL